MANSLSVVAWGTHLEAAGQHLVGLVKAEHLDGVGAEGLALDHVEYAAWGADDNVDAGLKGGHALADRGAADGSVALDVEVVTEGEDDLLNLLSQLAGGGKDEGLALLSGVVDGLKNRAGKGGGLAGAGLGLSNHVAVAEGNIRTVLMQRQDKG